MGVTATLTLHLVEDFGYEAEIAYYFLVVWGVG